MLPQMYAYYTQSWCGYIPMTVGLSDSVCTYK